MTKLYDKFTLLKGKDTDPRTRRYLVPQKIVWTSARDGASVLNPESLLLPKTGQITLDTGNACVLQNESGKPKASILIDFGIEIHGSAKILVWGVKGDKNRANIRIRFGESAMEAMTDLGVKNTTNDHANRDEVINVGFMSANETNETGYRFIRIDLLDDEAQIELKAIEGVLIYRDIDYRGSFECNDPLLNQIWNVAAYTAHLNMQEYLWDGIKRDRLVWIGDMHTEVMTISSVFGYNEVVPKSLDLVRNETPIGNWMNGISSYSIWWLLIHFDWYMSFGNYDYLTEQREYLMKLLDILSEKVNENGVELMPEGRFIDWPNNANPEAIHAGLQGLLLIALEKGEFLASILCESDTVIKCRKSAEKLRNHIPDPNGSKQAASFLVLAGLADPKKTNDDLLSVGGAKGYSTFLGYYTLAAKAMAEDYTGALDAIREYWGGMIKMGATTFWEDFNLDWLENAVGVDQIVPSDKVDIHGDWGAYCYVKFRHSLCHGWSSGPAPWLSSYVLGVQIMEPACKKVKIIPHLGDLSFAKGTYPTPYGNIEIFHAKMADGSIKSEINAPKEIEVIR